MSHRFQFVIDKQLRGHHDKAWKKKNYHNSYFVFHTVSSQYFRSLSISVISVSNFQQCITCFRIFSWNHNIHFYIFVIWQFFFFFQISFLRMLIASYGARVRGSVFKMKYWALSREFESIETSPGFVQLLGENWV